MEDYKYLSKIERIEPKNDFLTYITDRVVDNDYRGIQCSQHNRLTFDYFDAVLNSIYDIAGDEIYDIHIGDDNDKPQPQASTYYAVVKLVKHKTGKGTINSIKKNTFPDLARMGFLDRYDKEGNIIDEFKGRKPIYSVRLSNLGKEYVTSEKFNKIKLFTDGVDKITENTASDLVELLYLNEYGINSIDILEYMYIFSDDRPNISYNDKLGLLVEYRKLSFLEKQKVDYYLKLFCNPANRKKHKNKTLLRDYSNWKNESQQIYGLLANSTYFKVENNKLILNTGNYGIFDVNTTRKEKSKLEYIQYHNIDKGIEFEFHHIVPFSMASNKNDTIYLDSYKNLIYLHKDKHLEFTRRGNNNVRLRYEEGKEEILFLDFEDGFIIVDMIREALMKKSLLPSLKKYNDSLIKRFYYRQNVS